MNDKDVYERIKNILDNFGFSAEIVYDGEGKSLDLEFALDENNNLPFSPIRFDNPKELVGNLIQLSRSFQNKDYLRRYSENLVDEFTDSSEAKFISELVGYWFGKCINPLDTLYGRL